MARLTTDPRARLGVAMAATLVCTLHANSAAAQQPAPAEPPAAKPDDQPGAAKPAAPAAPDEPLTPPPGTPGSTRADEPLTPPPGTPGSTASKARPSGPRPKLSASAFPPPPPESAPLPFRPEPAQGYKVSVSSRTYLRLFQSKYLGGGIESADTQTEVPIYEYASLRVDDVNAPWQKQSTSLRLSAWGMLNTVEVADTNRLTGDLTTANVRSQWGPGYVVLGRQIASGGAARFTRFDGVMAGLRLHNGLGADAYGGFTVTPRFNARPEYVLLGSSADSLLRNPNAFPSVSETSQLVGGGRLSYSMHNLGSLGASIHQEQYRGEVGRKWTALDANLTPWSVLALGGHGALDLVSYRIADARGYADVLPPGPVSVTLDVLHTNPAAFLSRTSVLSVFSLDTFTEAGGELTWKIVKDISLSGNAHHAWYTTGDPGNRFGGNLRAYFGNRRQLLTQVRYGRVTQPTNGYHSVRGSVSYTLPVPLILTAEIYEYVYDNAIRNVNSSTVGSGSVEYAAPGKPWRLMVGGFASQTPYATLETQGIARFSYDLDVTGGAR
jgi:hypothetical protein